MLRLLLTIVLFLHGFIHLIGFAKAFGNADGATGASLAKPLGGAWLLAALLLMTGALLQLFQKQHWWIPAGLGLLLSKALIIAAWSDARWGTVANLLLLVPVCAGFATSRFEGRYRSDVAQLLAQTAHASPLLTEACLAPLPAPVQRYLRFTRAVGKPRPRNVFITLEGRMRGRKQNWFAFHSEQYNFFQPYARLFYMKGTFGGLLVPGYHRYRDSSASMQVRPLGMIPAVNAGGPELFRGESVTLLNDICLLAPGALCDPRISWTPIDDRSAQVHFANGAARVSATLLFNDSGALVNFISDDRYEVNSRQTLRFETPVRDYRLYGDHFLPSIGEAIWHYPDGPFTYGEFRIRGIRYNVQDASFTAPRINTERRERAEKTPGTRPGV